MKRAIILIAILISFMVYALPAAAYDDYDITGYDIKINVNENNTYDITEVIDVNFNGAHHGIYRDLPRSWTLKRADGTTAKVRAAISNISVSDQYEKSKSGNNIRLKIGDPDQTITGEKTYTIKYTYNVGTDKGEGFDEFYFNLVGSEWEVPISGITFSINMPKEFSIEEMGFTSGPVGSAGGSEYVDYSVSGNTITGSFSQSIYPGSALTIRVPLSEGYFVGAEDPVVYGGVVFSIIFITLTGVLLAISFLFWTKNGRQRKIVETVEFYPPEGLNSLYVGHLYKGAPSLEATMSLLIYLANKGYIAITEIPKKGLFSSGPDFALTKLREYNGNDPNEALFMHDLFSSSSIGTSIGGLVGGGLLGKYISGHSSPGASVSQVLMSDKKNKFYPTVERINNNVNSPAIRGKIFEKGRDLARVFSCITMALTAFLLFLCVYLISDSGGSIDGTATIFILFAIVSIGVMIVLLLSMNRRSEYGAAMLGKIEGFRNFLKTAEKPKLEALVMQDPAYFYNILPYTYALGISKKWIGQFADMAMAPPNWYYGPDTFNMIVFSHSMNSLMSAANSAGTAPSSDGGGFGGGGFSGGGGGGGGGGAW